MKKVIVTISVILAIGLGSFVIFIALNGYIADPAFPYSYVTPSPDNKFIFVMIGPKAPESTDDRWTDKDMERSLKLQNQYPAGGLYINDGSTTPLWELSDYSYSVFVPSDGVHLVRPGVWATRPSDEALSFYENGKLLRSYRVKDLVDFPWLLPGGHGHYDWDENITLDDQNRNLIVNTPHHDHFVFDLATGNITSARRPDRLIISYLSLSLLAVLIIRRQKSRAFVR